MSIRDLADFSSLFTYRLTRAVTQLLTDLGIRATPVGLPTSLLRGSASFDPASLADGAGVTTTVTVTGAAVGDYVLVSFDLNLQGITVTAYVSAANTVSVRFQNETTSTLDLTAGTLSALVLQF